MNIATPIVIKEKKIAIKIGNLLEKDLYSSMVSLSYSIKIVSYFFKIERISRSLKPRIISLDIIFTTTGQVKCFVVCITGYNVIK